MWAQQAKCQISWSLYQQRRGPSWPWENCSYMQMEPPCSVADLRFMFMGMVDQMGKFSPNIIEFSKLLLLSTKCAWLWGSEQERDLHELKLKLTWPTVVALYDLATRFADASSSDLKNDQVWLQHDEYDGEATLSVQMHSLRIQSQSISQPFHRTRWRWL